MKLTVAELVSNIASVVRDARHSDIYKNLPPVPTLGHAIPVNAMNIKRLVQKENRFLNSAPTSTESVLSSADVARRLMFIRKTGQMADCCQNTTLGALSSRSALSVLVGELFKKFYLFFEYVSYTSLQCILKHYESISFVNHKVFSVHDVRSLSFQYMLHAKILYSRGYFINWGHS